MTWILPAFDRMPLDEHEICERTDCATHEHRASYRVESVHAETGVVRRAFLCTKAAASLAHKLGAPFPPGPKRNAVESR